MPRLALLAALLLAACGGSGEDTPEPYEDRETVFDPMTDTIDRAKAVEEMTDERKKELDAALEEAEGRQPE